MGKYEWWLNNIWIYIKQIRKWMKIGENDDCAGRNLGSASEQEA